MLASVVVALLLQAPATAPQDTAAKPATPPKTAADSTPAEKRRARRAKRAPKRLDVTAEALATAYRDAGAKTLLLQARSARLRQDSSLTGYDATTYQRISAGFAVSRLGRDRLAYRSESATRVRWRRGIGAYVDVTGARAVIPIAGSSGSATSDGDISPIPYYPGSENMWIGASTIKTAVDENDGFVHPLAEGAEAYYTYETGDSVVFRLPDRRTINLRELRVRPRMPKWNLAVGSLWFDSGTGQLVRAAYRMSVPMDIVAVAKADDSTEFDDVPRVLRPLMFPMTAQISAIGVEYGLFQGRFWLPRLQVAEGGAHVGMIRVPFKLEQRYQYQQVNGTDSLPPIVMDSTTVRRGVNAGIRFGGNSERDSIRAARRAEARKRCDSSDTRSYTRSTRGGMAVLVRIPCDSAKLANSPDLPKSIYDEGDVGVSDDEMKALVADALSMGAQPDFLPQPPVVELDRPRYNRIEGLSLGGRVDQTLGQGYSAHALGRIGVADRQPVLELGVSRSDLRRTLALTAYNRLVSASDWGNPLSLGSSISALMFGRDNGYYYRASGVELTSTPDEASPLTMSWSLFAEHERTAERATTFSLARAIAGVDFDTNVVAKRGLYLGGRTRVTNTLGLDPQGFRLLTDLRLEAARGDSGGFGRAALDVTASRGFGQGAVALTLGGGTSVGALPPQRGWFLGGAYTVRGQAPGLEPGKFGDAFWMARAEAAHGLGIVRPVVFADIGWAGDRTRWRDIGRPLSGAGIGATIADGLLRVDLSRGIYPSAGFRVDTYVEARF